VYKIEVGRLAAKDLERIYRSDRTLYQRFLNAFRAIAQDPHQGKPLHGELRGLTSYRLGSYRIIYEIRHAQLLVIVIDLGHRRHIYR
jgi:mRNA interferase RelE/StbE